mmetsp:Transcript_124849/g.244860  ORF Transcript_124849/g.244860 Transcript_124849/m.244860 type:complete len:114 (+) Transcript_124849:147-488(+)
MASIALPQALLPRQVELTLGYSCATLSRVDDEPAEVLEQDLDELEGCDHEVIVLAAEEVQEDGQERLARVQIQRRIQVLSHHRSGEVAEDGVVLRHIKLGTNPGDVAPHPQVL